MFKILQNIKSKVKTFIRIKESKYFISFAFLLFIVILLDITIYFHEVPEDNTINSVIDIIWWNVVTLTTVGYGDMYPTTLYGKIATILIMICGIATFAYLLSALVEYVVEINQRRELGLMRIKMENHIIICNWNERAKDLLDQLQTFEDVRDEIVLIDNGLDTRPCDFVHFVKGSSSDVNTLNKANITKAQRIIILAKGNDSHEADANTVLTALAIRSICPKVVICAEILDPNNSLFLKNAKVDHIIDIHSLISRFIAQTAYNPKLLTVLNELVSNEDDSCEIYRCKLPDNLRNLSYIDLFTKIKTDYDCIIIALENTTKKQVYMNPKLDQIYDADYCFVISEDQPEFK